MKSNNEEQPRIAVDGTKHTVPAGHNKFYTENQDQNRLNSRNHRKRTCLQLNIN